MSRRAEPPLNRSVSKRPHRRAETISSQRFFYLQRPPALRRSPSPYPEIEEIERSLIRGLIQHGAAY